jgi:hypothetical protein
MRFPLPFVFSPRPLTGSGKCRQLNDLGRFCPFAAPCAMKIETVACDHQCAMKIIELFAVELYGLLAAPA